MKMNLSETDIIQLEAYWAGQLEADEQAAIEKRLEEDQAFQAAAMEWELIVKEGFMPSEEELEEAETIKQRLLTYSDKEVRIVQKKIERSNRYRLNRRVYIGLAAAAAVAVLLWVSPLREIFQSDPYGEFFTHLSRDNANLSNEAVDGKKAYDERDYKAAYPALLAEVETGGDSLNLIYASVAAIGSQQAEQAISILKPLAEDESWYLYHDEIQWYLALAYLKIGAQAEAITLLQNLIETKSAYETEAKNLLAQINQN